MPKYKVSFLAPMLVWDKVDTSTQEGAEKQCWDDPMLSRLDLSEGPFYMHSEKIEEEEEEEEEKTS